MGKEADKKKAYEFKAEMERIYDLEREKLEKRMMRYVVSRSGLFEMLPKCYGSGDGQPWCRQCTFQNRC